MSDDELAQCAKVRGGVQRRCVLMDQFHRLENPSRNDYRLFQYSSQSGAVLFAFLPQSRLGHTSTTVRLRGLGPSVRYRFTHDWQQREASGSTDEPRNPAVDAGDYASTIIRFDRVGN